MLARTPGVGIALDSVIPGQVQAMRLQRIDGMADSTALCCRRSRTNSGSVSLARSTALSLPFLGITTASTISLSAAWTSPQSWDQVRQVTQDGRMARGVHGEIAFGKYVMPVDLADVAGRGAAYA